MRFIIRPGEMIPFAGLMLWRADGWLNQAIPWFPNRNGMRWRLLSIPTGAIVLVLPFWTSVCDHLACNRFGIEHGRVLYTLRVRIGFWKMNWLAGWEWHFFDWDIVRRPIGAQEFTPDVSLREMPRDLLEDIR